MNLLPLSTEARLTKIPPTIHLSLTSFSRWVYKISIRYPRLSPSPIILAIISYSWEILRSKSREISSSSPFHSFNFKHRGSTNGKYSAINTCSVAKWMSAERLIVVSLGTNAFFLREAIKGVSLNITLSSDVGVYCKMALIVPCRTSGLWLASNSIRSLTSSGAKPLDYDEICSYSWCINN